MRWSWIHWVCLGLCGFSFWLHFSPLDLEIQRLFYYQNQWLIHPDDPLFNAFLYRWPKVLIVIFSVVAFFSLLWNKLSSRKIFSQDRALALVVFLAVLALYPLFINLLKDLMRQPCPRNLVEFGGSVDESLWSYMLAHRDLRCFPGAHAAAPFSLLSFNYFFSDKYNRALYLICVLPLAMIVAMYQVARGVHFVSDTLFTAFCAWPFIEGLHYLVTNKFRTFFKKWTT